ncbi:MAG: DUF3769 domain-containing protein [Cyanobacteria bacterium J06639_16]
MPYPVIPPEPPATVQVPQLEIVQSLPITDAHLDTAVDPVVLTEVLLPPDSMAEVGVLEVGGNDQGSVGEGARRWVIQTNPSPNPTPRLAGNASFLTSESISPPPTADVLGQPLEFRAPGIPARESPTSMPSSRSALHASSFSPNSIPGYPSITLPSNFSLNSIPGYPSVTLPSNFSPNGVSGYPSVTLQSQTLPPANGPSSRLWIDGGVRSPIAVEDTEPPEPAESPEPAEPTEPTDDTSDDSQADAPAPVHIWANQQTYDQFRQVVNASGEVVLRSGDAILDADRLWLNLLNRITVAEGNVALNRGGQVIRGDRAEYNLLQETGVLYNARGELFLPTLSEDFSNPPSNDVAAQATIPLSDRILSNQPLTDVTNPGNFEAGFGTTSPESGSVRRLRFEAASLQLTEEGWEATDITLTNDPFSPPELEFRAESAQLVNLSVEEDELRLSRARTVFDQGFSIPIPVNRILLRRGEVDTNELNPLPTGIGIDDRDRGGLFIERSLRVPTSGNLNLTITPQFYVSRFVSDPDFSDLSVYGIVGDLSGVLSPTTTFRAAGNLPGLNPDDIGNRLRASVRAQQLLGQHVLALEYSYRNRLFNGSLGFQDVQSSVGGVLTSPVFQLGDTGINLSYQVGAQYVTAETDLSSLLSPNRRDDLVTLGRFQGSVFLSRGFTLWRGEGLPATPDQGLRYSPSPVIPAVGLSLGLRGVATYYTSDQVQQVVTGTIAINGQFGHFSRQTFDYTRVNLAFSQDFIGGEESPFLFDRNADNTVLSGGIVQQIYGPVRAGVQASINLSSGEQINTDYILEYSRRTYGFVIRYNASQGSGFIGFRLSDFNWSGSPDSFGGGVRPVSGGVIQ